MKASPHSNPHGLSNSFFGSPQKQPGRWCPDVGSSASGSSSGGVGGGTRSTTKGPDLGYHGETNSNFTGSYATYIIYNHIYIIYMYMSCMYVLSLFLLLLLLLLLLFYIVMYCQLEKQKEMGIGQEWLHRHGSFSGSRSACSSWVFHWTLRVWISTCTANGWLWP